MAQHTDDMSQVPNPGEVVPEAWYQFRISKVEEGESDNSGAPTVYLQLKIQSEGPAMGRVVQDNCSLQAHALFKLKAYYIATGYQPAPGQGHDPDHLLDGEGWVKVDHKIVDGVTRTDIKPWNIKSLLQGPGK